jgi:hypothetical protein
MEEVLLDIDVDDFKSFINSVETLLMVMNNHRVSPDEVRKVRLAVKNDCAYFTDLIKKAETK